MRTREIMVEIRRPKTRLELRRERRLRILDNVLNVLLGVGAVAASIYGGWLVGSGAFW